MWVGKSFLYSLLNFSDSFHNKVVVWLIGRECISYAKLLKLMGSKVTAFLSCHLQVTDAYIETTLDVHVQGFRQQQILARIFSQLKAEIT